MFSMWYFLSLYLQQVIGYGPLKAGLCFLPLSGVVALGSLRGAAISARLGIRRTLLLALLLDAVGLAWLSRISAHGSFLGDVLGPSFLLGFGMGLGFVPLTTAAMAGVARHEAGLASGIVNVSRQIGGALGLAILATIATSRTSGVLHGRHPAAGSRLEHVALAEGFGRALMVASVFALVGAAAVLAFVRATPRVPPEAAATAVPAEALD
jgi:predicted MFS family arabinose efflux permease